MCKTMQICQEYLHTGALQDLKCFDTRSHGQGVPGESACLVHWPCWCHCQAGVTTIVNF